MPPANYDQLQAMGLIYLTMILAPLLIVVMRDFCEWWADFRKRKQQ
jgi:hypothetical protein